MDELNTDSDSHSVTSNQSTSSGTSNKLKAVSSLPKETSAQPAKPASTKRKPHDEDGKVASTPKRKKTDGTDPSGAAGTTPGSSTRKAAPLSERQQMALALAMSAQESGGTSPSQTAPGSAVAPDSTPRSAMLRKVNRRNEKGESPLHLATIKGDVEGMKRLMKAGADVNVPDYAGWTALHEACNHGFVNAARLLLRKGATVNAQGLDNDTPLHDAAINGHPELVALLLKYGANPHQANSKGESPLDVATQDDIIKLLRKETIYKLASDESDTPASSPEGMHPVDEQTSNISPSDSDIQPLKPDTTVTAAAPLLKYQSHPDHRQTGEAESRPVNPSLQAVKDQGGISMMGTSPVSPGSSSSRPASRPSSTGFSQDLDKPEAEKKQDVVVASAGSEFLTKRSEENKPEGISGQSTAERSAEVNRNPQPEVITVQPETLLAMEGLVPLQTVDTAALAKTARQSLNFKPILLASDVADVSPSSNISPDQLIPTGVTTATKTATATEPQKSVPDPQPNVSEVKTSVPSHQGIAQTLTSSQDSIEVDEHALPSYVPFSGIKDTVIASSVRAPLSATMSTGFGDITHGASRPITPDSAASVMTSAAKENKKKPERSKTPTPELTKESKPSSPAPERRTRTGSMHRKRRQANTPQPSPLDPPVAAEGDNSVDSTDSHVSSNSSGTTRASRSRNKPASQTPQPDEETLPVRETRRKAMLKERAMTNSPSIDKQAKSGSQKVPPLTIKLGSKSPVNTTQKEPMNTTISVGQPGSSDPFVMLADKDTEKANIALSKEQEKSPDSTPSQEPSASVERKERSTTPTPTSLGVLSQTTTSATTTTTTSGVTTRRTLRSHTNRNQAATTMSGAGEKREAEPEPPALPRKSKRMKQEVTAAPPTVPPTAFPPPPGPMTIFNPYNLFKDVREQMCKKWERIVAVNPRAPAGYPNYLIKTKKYLLLKNSSTNASKLAIPLLAAPTQLTQPMKDLFNKQEQERYKLRQQHIIEGEKLRIAYEQEIVRVYTKGARASAGQETPLSVCTVLKDKESGTVYHPFNALKDGCGNGQSTAEPDKPATESRANRSHFNNRQLLSWLQDSEDKFEKLKDQMLSRHHHESESLYAVQTMNWEWKLKECGLCDYKSQPTKDMLHIPMVLVNDDADILNAA